MDSQGRIRRTKVYREAEGYLELGLPRHALGALSRLGEPAGFDARAMHLWGEALRSMQRYREAIVPLSHAAEADPENIQVWLALGWCYKRTGRLDLAIDALKQALVADPEEALLHYNLACYWSLSRDRGQSLAALAKALALEPGYCELVAEESDFDFMRNDPDFRTLCDGGKVKN